MQPGHTMVRLGATKYGVQLNYGTFYVPNQDVFPWPPIDEYTPLNVACQNGIMYGFIYDAKSLTAASFKKVVVTATPSPK